MVNFRYISLLITLIFLLQAPPSSATYHLHHLHHHLHQHLHPLRPLHSHLATMGAEAFSLEDVFKALYAFGESLTDAGNAMYMGILKHAHGGSQGASGSSPSGNRLCNGKLLIDFVCEALGIPPVPAFQNASANFTHGANFAVAGSTALPSHFFAHNNIQNWFLNTIPKSIELQINWFHKFRQDMVGQVTSHLVGGGSGSGSGSMTGSGSGYESGSMSGKISGSGHGSVSGSGNGNVGGSMSGSGNFSGSMSGNGGGSGGVSGSGGGSGSVSGSMTGKMSGSGSVNGSGSIHMEGSLFWIGGIGLSDYPRLLGSSSLPNQWFTQHTVNQVYKLIEALLENGAKYVVVQGLPPCGCFPVTLALTPTSDRDQYGCSASANAMATAHNELLQKNLAELQKKYSSASIIYADFWKAYMNILQNHDKYNFTEPFKACCGVGSGAFNFDVHHLCGSINTAACKDATQHMIWDGIHLTEAMNKEVTKQFLNHGCTSPPLQEVIKKKMG